MSYICVDRLERKLKAMPGVESGQVSLKNKKIRLGSKDDSLSVETIKQAILDAGFTPVKVTQLTDENQPR